SCTRRANAEDAICLFKVVHLRQEKEHRVTELTADTEITMADDTTVQRMEEDAICIEDRMRELGLLSTSSYLEKYHDSTISLDDDTPAKKVKVGKAYSTLDILVTSHPWSLYLIARMISVKCAATEELCKLSGRLQLITAQIDKAGSNVIIPPLGDMKPKEGEDEGDDEEDEEIDEIVYGEEDDASESSGDDSEERMQS
ncbi:hypothetical protein ACMD2_20549, partial [Ananas comosus]